jgi:hypothetical protein
MDRASATCDPGGLSRALRSLACRRRARVRGLHEAKREPIAGRAAIAAHWAPFFHGGPAWRMTVHDLFGGGDRFAVSYIWEVAAPDGTWSGSPGCAIVHVRDGQIALWREYKG